MKNKIIIILLLIVGSVNGQSTFQFGVNGFHWTPLGNIQIFDQERLYVSWPWIQDNPTKLKFDPTYSANGNFDRKLDDMRLAHIDPILCIHQSPKWLFANAPDYNPDWMPCPLGWNTLDPKSFKAYSSALWQVTARYGRVAYPKSQLQVDTLERWTNEGKNKLVSGLGLVKYVEVWNEPNKYWLGDNWANMEPEEYAAMLSACYDGHEGRLGFNCGIKMADLSMKVVMGGLAGLDTTYLKRMSVWFTKNRTDKRFPCDVINVHQYCNFGDNIGEGIDYGISPEDDRLYEKLTGVVNVVKRIAPHCQVWLTEFGYDDNKSSPQYADIKNQGAWLSRTFLEAWRAGFSAAHIYSAADERNVDGGLFQSSGIMYGESSSKAWSVKPSYKTLQILTESLRGKRLIWSKVADTNTRTMLFEDGKGVWYVSWNPKNTSIFINQIRFPK